MMNFIDLVILTIISYLILKFTVTYIANQVRWAFVDKSALLQENKLRYENTIYAHDFFKLERDLIGRGFKTEGVYIFTNQRTSRKYVGQSVDLIRRINEHLNGRGSEDVHSDMLLGDEFTIRLIKLNETKFRSLDRLEKHHISRANSFYNGYNKTRGNG